MATNSKDLEYETKKEIAARLRKTPKTIDNWMRDRGLPYIKIGHSVLFQRSSVNRFLDNLSLRGRGAAVSKSRVIPPPPACTASVE